MVLSPADRIEMRVGGGGAVKLYSGLLADDAIPDFLLIHDGWPTTNVYF